MTHPFYNRENHGPFELFDLGDMVLAAGGTLRAATLAYATFGTLSPSRDNAILVRLSSDRHVSRRDLDSKRRAGELLVQMRDGGCAGDQQDVGERRSNQANATCRGIASKRVATSDKAADCNGLKPPSGKIVWAFERDGEVVCVKPDGPLLISVGAATDLAVDAALAGTGIITLFED